MATRQSLKGSSNKLYDVIANFNKGIDRSTADDVSIDSSFRELKNMYNEKEGVLSKRPGIYDSKFNYFMEYLNDNFTTAFGSTTLTKYNDIGDTYSRFNMFYSFVLNGANLTIPSKYFDENDPLLNDTDPTETSVILSPKNIVGFHVVKESNFHDFLERFDRTNPNSVFEGDNPITSAEYNVNIICNCDSLYPATWSAYQEGLYDVSCLFIYKMHIKITGNSYNGGLLNITNDLVCSAYNPRAVIDGFWTHYYLRWKYGDVGKEGKPMDIVSYNGATYAATGKNYILKILDEFPATRVKKTALYSNEYNIITEIGGELSNTNLSELYMPTPVEVSGIGFNILATDPLSYVENTGTADAIKGLFYTINTNGSKEPISDIPANRPFNIHILQTGTGTLGVPQYRPDNGDTSTTTNPYKNVPGAFNGTYPYIFECTGLNADGKYEIKTTKGSVTFLSYISTGMNYNKETGLISTIKDLIFSSTHAKIINNQLVLYGGHEYIFFSEYDNFYYFPNYFNLYVAKDNGEQEVTSINYFRQYYAVFTNTKIRRLTGSFGSDDFGIYPLNDFVGCTNGKTIKQVNNNLLFVSDDGLYKLKQGYTGEGTENVEKIDKVLGESINTNTINQAFVLSTYYIMMFSNKDELILYDYEKDAFYEYAVDGSTIKVTNNPDNNQNYDNALLANARSLSTCFHSMLSDSHGQYLYIPDYEHLYIKTEIIDWTGQMGSSEPIPTGTYYLVVKRGAMKLRMLRMSDLSFLDEEDRKEDNSGYISEIETPNITMGTPTNTKKFKEVYIKMVNDSNTPIPLYITIYVDDVAYISPNDYEVRYDEIANAYYYVYTNESNVELTEGAEILEGQEVLGTLTLGEDVLGNKSTYQLKLRLNKKGRTIKIKINDGYDDTNEIYYYGDDHELIYHPKVRNIHNFTITAIGIVYKLKKVKEG